MRARLLRHLVQLIRRPEAPPRPEAEPARIAVVRVQNIGDVVTATGLLDALRARYPHATITAVVTPAAAPLLHGHGAVDTVVPFTAREGLGPRRPIALLRDALALRRRIGPRQDVAFVLEQGPALLLAAALPARWKAGFAAGDGRFAWMLTHRVTSHGQDAGRQLSYRYRLFQEPLARFTGDNVTPHPPRLSIDPDRDRAARVWLAEQGITTPFVVLGPGGTSITRRWPAKRFAAAANSLAARGDLAVVVVGGPAERAIAGEFAGTRAVNAIGALDLATTAAVIGRARAVLANDTSVMHMAVALGIPTVAVFGGSPWQRAGYEPERLTVLAAGLSCQPCGQDRCPYAEVPPCLTELPAERAVAAVRAMLDATA